MTHITGHGPLQLAQRPVQMVQMQANNVCLFGIFIENAYSLFNTKLYLKTSTTLQQHNPIYFHCFLTLPLPYQELEVSKLKEVEKTSAF